MDSTKSKNCKPQCNPQCKHCQFPNKKIRIVLVMIIGLISFTCGVTQKSLISAVESAQLSGRSLDHTVLTESVLMSEKANGMPTTPLQFKNTPSTHASLFHSTFMPVDQPVISKINPVEYGPLNTIAYDRYSNPPLFAQTDSATPNWFTPSSIKQTVSKQYQPKPIQSPPQQQPPPYQRIWTFLKVGSGSGQNSSGSATLVRRVVLNDAGLRRCQ
jgi:hypothetical protein